MLVAKENLAKPRKSYNKSYHAKRRRDKKELYAFYTATRFAAKLLRTPKWLTRQHKIEIKAFYKQAAEATKNTGIKHAVDHIIPLQGAFVSGLNVPWNLQILTASENSRKGNRLERS